MTLKVLSSLDTNSANGVSNSNNKLFYFASYSTT